MPLRNDSWAGDHRPLILTAVAVRWFGWTRLRVLERDPPMSEVLGSITTE